MSVHLAAGTGPTRGTSILRIHVGRDLDGLRAALSARGVAVLSGPESLPWGVREFEIGDPDGHRIRFWGNVDGEDVDDDAYPCRTAREREKGDVILRTILILGFGALLATGAAVGCSGARSDGGAADRAAVDVVTSEQADLPVATTIPALRYRRLAWSPEMRDRWWLDEVYVPRMGVVFNLETATQTTDGEFRFLPIANAFFADGPVGYSEDVHGRVPVTPEVTPVEIPADVAVAALETARLGKALDDARRKLGARVDAIQVLPAVIGSPRWEPPPPK